MPITINDLPSERLKRVSAANANVFQPSLAAFQGQLHPAVANVFGVGQPTPQPAPPPAPAPAPVAPAPPAQAPAPPIPDEEPFMPFSFDDALASEPPAGAVPAGDEPFTFHESQASDSRLVAGIDEVQSRTDEELTDDLFFIPGKYISQLWAEGQIITPELEERLLRIEQAKTEKGISLADLVSLAKRTADQSPEILRDALVGAGQIGKNIWNQAAGDTVAEKAASSQKLLAAVELAGVESGGLLMNLVPPLKGAAEFSATAATGGGLLKAARRGVGETVRGLVPEFLLPESAEKFVESAISQFDPRDPLDELYNRAGRYFEYDKARKGEGVIAETLGLSGEEMKNLGIVLDPEEIDAMSIWIDPANLVPVAAGAKAWNLVEKTTNKTIAKAASKLGVQNIKNQLVKSGFGVAKKAATAVAGAPRKAVAKTLTKAGKAAEVAGEYTIKKIGGIAMATGLATALSGNPQNLVYGAGIILGGGFSRAFGKKLAQAGINFGARQGAMEWLTRQAKTAGKGAVAGYASAMPLAALADDPEMAAGILASGVLGSYGALGAAAKENIRGKTLNQFHKAWDQADVNPVASAPYAETGEAAADTRSLNQAHLNAMRKMSTSPLGRKSAALVSRLREAYRTVVNPNTGQAQQTRIWILPAEDFKTRFGADAHGKFVGNSPEGTYDIFLSEDTTGLHHEVGHLMDALLTPEQRAKMEQAIEKNFGDEKIESTRQLYQDLLNLNLTPGTPQVEITRDQAVNELMALHFSLTSRGNPLDGSNQDANSFSREYVGSVLQRAFPGLAPRVGPGAITVEGLQIEPSFEVTRTAREAAQASGLPTAPVEVVETQPGQQLPPTPPETPGAPPSGPEKLIETVEEQAAVEAGETLPGIAQAPVAPAPEAISVPRGTGVTPRGALPPVSAAEQPENLRGPQTGEFAEGRTDVKDLNDVERVLRDVEADPNFSEDQKNVLRTIAQGIREVGSEGGALTSIFYQSVRPTESKKGSQRRWQRRNEQANAYYQEALKGPDVKAETRQIFQKNIIPYRFQAVGRDKKKVHVIGLSPDKVLGNANILLNDLGGSTNPQLKAMLDWFPKSWEYVSTPEGLRFTANGLDAMAADLSTFSNNHANGYTGKGDPIIVPPGYQRFVPAPTPGFSPTPLPASTATALNVMMGLAPPTTTTQRGAGAGRDPVTGQKVTIPANVEAQILATENGLTPVPSTTARFTKKEAKARGLAGVTVEAAGVTPEFTVPELGGQTFPIMEVNPMRQQMAAQGYDAKQSLTEAVERINLEDIVTEPGAPTAGVQVKATTIAPVSVPVATAGFLPKNQALRMFSDVNNMPASTFSEWASKQADEGGITGRAYQVGISLAQDTDTAGPMSQEFQKQAAADAVQAMKDGDFDGALALGIKGQFFREARETMNDEGSMKGFSSTVGLKYPDLLMRHHAAGSIIRDMQAGTEFGKTLNADGTVFDSARLTESDPADSSKIRPEPLDVVTMASVNLPLSDLTHQRLKAELQPYVDALGSNRVKPGLFKLEAKGPRGETMVSIDINALVNQKHRANSTAFAAANNQESIYDLTNNEVVETGGTGETTVTDPASLRTIADQLVEGKMPDVPKTGETGAFLLKDVDEFVSALENAFNSFPPLLRRGKVDPNFEKISTRPTARQEFDQMVGELRDMLYAEQANPDKIGGQFLPRATPGIESIKAAAVRSRKTGQVFTGVAHFAAMGDAIRTLKIGPVEIAQHFPDLDNDQGFVTSEGRYVDRTEAAEIGRAANQLKEVGATVGGKLVSEGLIGNRGLGEGAIVTAAQRAEGAAYLPKGDVLESPAGGGYTVRTTGAPKKTTKAYKLFRVKEDGNLYPLFVGAKDAVPRGLWINATEGKRAKPSKAGRERVTSELGPLAYRPGFHAGDVPLASHIGVKERDATGRSVQAGEIVARRPNEVWAEVELADDIDYQPEANEAGTNPKTGKVNLRDAEIKRIPKDGLYRYKTNPNMTGDWLISGAMKVGRVLPEAEVNSILEQAGIDPTPWAVEDSAAATGEVGNVPTGPLDIEGLGIGRALVEPTAPAFLPRRRKPQKVDFTKTKAAWILPNGDTRAVTSGRHENDLAANAAEYNEKFGTDFSTTPQEAEGREAALRAGFTRTSLRTTRTRSIRSSCRLSMRAGRS
jgi:hypothetical protein